MNIDGDTKLTLDDFKKLDISGVASKDLIFVSSQQDISKSYLKYLSLYIEEMHARKLVAQDCYMYAKEIVEFLYEEIKI